MKGTRTGDVMVFRAISKSGKYVVYLFDYQVLEIFLKTSNLHGFTRRRPENGLGIGLTRKSADNTGQARGWPPEVKLCSEAHPAGVGRWATRPS